MNQLPPLALQPLALPAPNPNAPQPNWNDMANALATIGNEIPNLPQLVSSYICSGFPSLSHMILLLWLLGSDATDISNE